MPFVLFVIFSVIEIVAFFYLCCSLFRFKAKVYLTKFIFVEIFIISGNYLIRQEEAYAGLASLFSLIMFILFLKIFIEEVSLFWAAIMGIVSFTITAIIQGLYILILINTTNFISLEEIQSNTLDSYFVQFTFALMIILPAHYLYKRGFGFTFNVDRFKLAGENIVMIFILFAILITVGIIFTTNNLLLISIVLLFPLIYLVYFAIRKQKKDVRNSSFLE